jgi:hypothetical protein
MRAVLQLTRSRRLARYVAAWILLWLAVLQVNAFVVARLDPPAATQSADADDQCDEHHDHHGQGPAHHTAANHFVQCPGCLFATAPPPVCAALPGAREDTVAVVPVVRPVAPHGNTVLPPPARGPPPLS